ncbi:hypothetical protein CCP3SC5AM1_210009 [Gammaproteobacteria bacterium]
MKNSKSFYAQRSGVAESIYIDSATTGANALSAQNDNKKTQFFNRVTSSTA